MKNFGAVFNCKLDGEEFTASNRTDMDEMLKKASAEHLMDDNDDYYPQYQVHPQKQIPK